MRGTAKRAPKSGPPALGAQATRPNGCRRAAGANLEQAVANRRVGLARPYRSWLGCREPCDRSRPAGSQKLTATRAVAMGRPALEDHNVQGALWAVRRLGSCQRTPTIVGGR